MILVSITLGCCFFWEMNLSYYYIAELPLELLYLRHCLMRCFSVVVNKRLLTPDSWLLTHAMQNMVSPVVLRQQQFLQSIIVQVSADARNVLFRFEWRVLKDALMSVWALSPRVFTAPALLVFRVSGLGPTEARLVPPVERPGWSVVAGGGLPRPCQQR